MGTGPHHCSQSASQSLPGHPHRWLRLINCGFWNPGTGFWLINRNYRNPESRLPLINCGYWNHGIRLPLINCGYWNHGTRLPLINCGYWNHGTRLPLINCHYRNHGTRLPLINCHHQNAGTRLPLINHGHWNPGTRLPLINCGYWNPGTGLPLINPHCCNPGTKFVCSRASWPFLLMGPANELFIIDGTHWQLITENWLLMDLTVVDYWWIWQKIGYQWIWQDIYYWWIWLKIDRLTVDYCDCAFDLNPCTTCYWAGFESLYGLATEVVWVLSGLELKLEPKLENFTRIVV